MPHHPLARKIPHLAKDGATVPLYASIREALVYDEANNRTVYAFEAWNGSDRRMYVGWRDHDAGTSHGPVDVGLTGYISNDDHGVPTLCKDHQNYWHVFGGSHSSGTRLRHARTADPDDLATWTVVTGFENTAVAYPKPVLVGDRIFVPHRGSGSNASKLRLVATSQLSGGALTDGYSAITDLIDFEDGTENRFYAGNIIKVGSELRGIAYRGDNADTTRRHVYFFRYDTANGSIKNHSGSVSVPSGSLPINLAAMDSDFRLFEHAGSRAGTDIPVWYYDRLGRETIWFADGEDTDAEDEGPYRIKFLRWNGSIFDAIDTGIDVIGRFATFAPVERRDGSIDLYFIDPDDRWPDDWSSTPSPQGGHVMMTRLAPDGSEIEAPMRVATATDFRLERFVPANPAHPSLRVLFTEIADGNANSLAGDKRLFGHGARGFV